MKNRLLTDLHRAYLDARKNKRNTVNQLRFELNLEENLYQLYLDVKQRRYQLSSSIAFVITEPTVREILAATFRDRVIHHLVYNYIYPYWDRQFITDSYSCRVGKGTHYGLRRMARFMRAVSDNYTREAWVMKLDISGYFMHMRRDLTWELTRRGLEKMLASGEITAEVEADLMYLLPIIIYADPLRGVIIKGKRSDWSALPRSKSLFGAPAGCGFPIGNLTSQLFSNIYLHQLDCLVKYRLGIKYYGRYVDDFVLMHRDKNVLMAVREQVREFLHDELALELHPRKMYLQPVEYGVEFVGGRVKPYCLLPGKRLVENYRRVRQQREGGLHPKSTSRASGEARSTPSSISQDDRASRSVGSSSQDSKVVLPCSLPDVHAWSEADERVWSSYVGQMKQFSSWKLLH